MNFEKLTLEDFRTLRADLKLVDQKNLNARVPEKKSITQSEAYIALNGNGPSWPVNEEQQRKVVKKRDQLRAEGMNEGEYWFSRNFLLKSPFKWTFKSIWGFRIFDFWHSGLGVGIMVNPVDHDPSLDARYDAIEWERSRVLIYRVKSMDNEDGQKVLELILQTNTWNERRLRAGRASIMGTKD